MKKILILGASSGLGQALARTYISRGCTVGLAARRLEPLEALAAEARPGQVVKIAHVDVNVPEAAVESLRQLLAELGPEPLDLYLHCAGIGRMSPEISFDAERPTLQTNVVGWTACIDMMYNHLFRQGYGQLAAITSFAANRGLAPAPSYSASKAFQAHYLEALRQHALAFGRSELCVTDLRPGFVSTPLLAHPERLFWVLSTERATIELVRAIDRRKQIATVSLRWRLFAPVLRLAPRNLVAAILRLAMK